MIKIEHDKLLADFESRIDKFMSEESSESLGLFLLIESLEILTHQFTTTKWNKYHLQKVKDLIKEFKNERKRLLKVNRKNNVQKTVSTKKS
jgi:hypothetical protein